jgi:hypothetical protein
MKTKPTTEDKVAEIDVWLRLVDNFFYNSSDSYETDGTIAEINRRIAKLKKERAALLSPRPKQPRKPKAVVPAVVDTGNGKARFDVDTSNLNRRGRDR